MHERTFDSGARIRIVFGGDDFYCRSWELRVRSLVSSVVQMSCLAAILWEIKKTQKLLTVSCSPVNGFRDVFTAALLDDVTQVYITLVNDW